MIYVVGLGPGGRDELSPRALAALERCDVLIGYQVYLDLIASFFPGKELRPSGMRQEMERCRDALALSLTGHKVGLVSGGDPGVYGMAGLMLEIGGEQTEIEIVPGITAATAAAAILGAPLTGDFAIISLSDLLTPWELIERRLAAVASSEFVICLYNPSSRGRPQHFQRACDVLLRDKSADTPAGWVRNAGRPGQDYGITTLGKIREEKLDMFCTVVIGNSNTVICNGRMITRRGYEAKS